MTTKQDAVQSFASNARGAEYKFLPAVSYALKEFERKNNAPLYRMIAFVNGKKFSQDNVRSLPGVSEGDNTVKLTQFKVPLQRVLNKTLSNVKFVFKDGSVKAKVGANGGVNADAIRELEQLLSFHGSVPVSGNVFKAAYPAPKTEKKTYDKVAAKKKIDAAFERLVRDLGMTESEIIAMHQAKVADIAAINEPNH